MTTRTTCRGLLVGLLSILVLIPGGVLSAGRPTYPYPVTPNLNEVYGVLASDLNDDGRLDLAITQMDLPQIQVLLGNDDGTFQWPIPYPTCDGSLYLDSGDFNSDGVLDLAVGCWIPEGGVSILLGNGDGTFAPEIRVVSHLLRQVAVGDLNADGHDDLVLGGPTGVLFGNGDGTFGDEQSSFVNGDFVTVDDFNGDAIDDLAIAVSSGSVVVYAGSLSGPLPYLGTSGAGTEPRYIAGAHLDGDDHLDLVVANTSTDTISVLLGHGDGTFAEPASYAVGNGPEHVVVSDFNRDGLPDVIAANYWSGPGASLSVLFGTGDGQLAAAVAVDPVRFGSYTLAVGDFDGDGLEDLAKPCRWCRDLGILFGNGDGTFGLPDTVGVGDVPKSVAVADLNGDDRLDLVTANHGTWDVSVLLANGAGTFSSETRYAAGVQPSWVAVGELTGDEHLDLAVANHASDDVSVLPGHGDGTFSGATSVPVYDEDPAEPSCVAVGDFNADGQRDLVVTDQLGNRVAVVLGNGDGTFQPVTHYSAGSAPSSVVVEDFDGDDDQDLAVANFGSNNISVLLNTGTGTFSQAPRPRTFSGPFQLAVGDLNGDLVPDLAVVVEEDCSSGEVCGKPGHIFLGNGDGTFADRIDTGFFWGDSIAIVDIDGDGRLDLIGEGPASVWRGNGDGTFQPPSHFAGEGEQVACGDFNLDGRMDLVVAANPLPILCDLSGPAALTIEGDRATLVWPAATGAITYDIYRGDIPDLVDGDSDGLPDDGYGDCMTALDDDPRDTFFVDAEMPSLSGTGFFYLIAVIDDSGSGGIGTTSAGSQREPAVPCP